MKPKYEVGQKIYFKKVQTASYGCSYSEKELDAVVTKVGRKYITVDCEGHFKDKQLPIDNFSYCYFREIEYHYAPSEEVYKEYLDKCRLWDSLFETMNSNRNYNVNNCEKEDLEQLLDKLRAIKVKVKEKAVE